MSARGWDLDIDGRFGPQSAGVAARFAAEKKITVDAGSVDLAVWKGAWEIPVS